ncbi:MAG: helix-turn-helix domain-containing protein [Myxococcales bacterium]|nr:helix-turn-helix domain-containing protein [Myxococcales bacterium]
MTIRSEIQILGVGGYLRESRERRRIPLSEVAHATRIPERTLRDIEEDKFEALPGSVFVRGYLRSYARMLGIDDRAIVGGFRGPTPSEDASPKPPTASVPAVSGSRWRFGLVISLVILGILFALTVSIMTRPRHREHKIELSSREVSCRQSMKPEPSFYDPSITARATASFRCLLNHVAG